MKQVLLCIPAVFAEVRFGKFAQPLRCDLLLPREITLSQDPRDPDIDGECAEPLVAEKHHAICNLRSHARQGAQVFSKLGIGKCRPRIQIRFTGTEDSSLQTSFVIDDVALNVQ